MNREQPLSIFDPSRSSGLLQRVLSRYLKAPLLDEIFPLGVPMEMVELLHLEPGINNSQEEIRNKIASVLLGTKFVSISGLPTQGPGHWGGILRSRYEGENLGPKKPLITQEILGKTLPKQEGLIVVYTLPENLSSLLTEYSRQIHQLFQSWKENHPDTLLDFVPYDQDNLHISIVQSEFLSDSSNFDHKTFASGVKSGEYNPIGSKYSGIGLPKDTLVVKYMPKSPLAHVANQILAASRTITGMSSPLSTQGWGAHITIGRFVGATDDANLRQGIGVIMCKLDQVLQGMGDQEFTHVEPKILTHCFATTGNSHFSLKSI